MYGYIRSNGDKPIIVKEAPEHIKNEARELNKLIEKKFGEKEHYIIEGITYESICAKLGFDPLVNPPKINYKGHEDDSEESPYAILTLEESKFLCDYVKKHLDNKNRL